MAPSIAQAPLRPFEPAPWESDAWGRARGLLLGCLDPFRPSLGVRLALARWPSVDDAALVACAEFHGMTPLLAWHARGSALRPLRRHLAALQARHALAARARHAVLVALLQQCQARGVDLLLLKGTALRYTVYPDAIMRPMRDMDLMPRADHLSAFLEAMAAVGFVEIAGLAPPQHHLVPQRCVHDGVTVCVEVHTGLDLSRGARIAPVALFDAALPCAVDGLAAWVPSVEHLLWHVYKHGFAMPFTSEATKLIWWADLHALGEHWASHDDFAAALQARPMLRHALAALHAVAPWSAQAQAALAPASLGRFCDTADYAGWPRARWRSTPAQAWGQLGRATFFPPAFWLAMRHGARPGLWPRIKMLVKHWYDLVQKALEMRSRRAR